MGAAPVAGTLHDDHLAKRRPGFCDLERVVLGAVVDDDDLVVAVVLGEELVEAAPENLGRVPADDDHRSERDGLARRPLWRATATGQIGLGRGGWRRGEPGRRPSGERRRARSALRRLLCSAVQESGVHLGDGGAGGLRRSCRAPAHAGRTTSTQRRGTGERQTRSKSRTLL